MKKILVTGGTTFVSKYAAEYFVNMGYEVYVLNRNTKSQVRGVKLNLNQIIPSAPEHISTASGTEGDFDLTK